MSIRQKKIKLSISEALEVRKQLKAQIKQDASQLMKSTYKEVVHKEERSMYGSTRYER